MSEYNDQGLGKGVKTRDQCHAGEEMAGTGRGNPGSPQNAQGGGEGPNGKMLTEHDSILGWTGSLAKWPKKCRELKST